jgi:hypothetical protein
LREGVTITELASYCKLNSEKFEIPEGLTTDFSLIKPRNVSEWEQFKLLLSRNLLELERNFYAIPGLAILAVFNGFLYLCLWYNIDATPITHNSRENAQYVANCLGLVFLIVMD